MAANRNPLPTSRSQARQLSGGICCSRRPQASAWRLAAGVAGQELHDPGARGRQERRGVNRRDVRSIRWSHYGCAARHTKGKTAYSNRRTVSELRGQPGYPWRARATDAIQAAEEARPRPDEGGFHKFETPIRSSEVGASEFLKATPRQKEGPLFFANAIYPLDVMPPWLKVVAHLNPLTDLVDALWALLLGTARVYDSASLTSLGARQPAVRASPEVVARPSWQWRDEVCGDIALRHEEEKISIPRPRSYLRS